MFCRVHGLRVAQLNRPIKGGFVVVVGCVVVVDTVVVETVVVVVVVDVVVDSVSQDESSHEHEVCDMESLLAGCPLICAHTAVQLGRVEHARE